MSQQFQSVTEGLEGSWSSIFVRSLKRLVLVSAMNALAIGQVNLPVQLKARRQGNSSPFPDVFVWATTLNVGNTFMVAAQTKTSGKGEPT